MNSVVVLVVIAALLTAISLGAGLFSMARGGDFDRVHSDQFMIARVASQAVALALMLIAVYVAG